MLWPRFGRTISAMVLASTGIVACASPAPRSAAPTPQAAPVDSTPYLGIDTLRGRESGRAGYVPPAPYDPRHHGPRRFYTGKNYGSEAEFNPLSELLNEGFDVLSVEHANRHVLERPYATDARNVLESVLHPIQSVSAYGWGNLLRAEILPTSLTRTRTSGKWISNYELHLFGSGMVSLRMTDWYEIHGFEHPALLGQATTMAAHYLNEMSENGGSTSLNEDPVVDLLLFDVAGFALWHQHWMQRTFSDRYQLTNWPGQPSYDPVNRTLENTGQYFLLRGPLPLVKTWDFFTVFGMSGTAGVSKTIGRGRALSLGIGFDAVPATPATDSTPPVRSATLPKATLYFDRNGSLMWSLTVNNRTDPNRVIVNVYPGVFRIHGFTTGVWLQRPRSGGIKGGLISTIGVGAGGSSRRIPP
jgi:hypothetical protein